MAARRRPHAPLRCLIDATRIEQRVEQLSREIAADFAGREPLLVGVLKGSFMFLADLARRLPLPIAIDFLRVASYGAASQTSGVVEIRKDLEIPIEGRDVLLIEDVVDTGLTLDFLLRTLEARRPASLRVCTLLDKPARRRKRVTIDYVGFSIDDVFVVGYGLDHAERYRELPYIAVREEPPP